MHPVLLISFACWLLVQLVLKWLYIITKNKSMKQTLRTYCAIGFFFLASCSKVADLPETLQEAGKITQFQTAFYDSISRTGTLFSYFPNETKGSATYRTVGGTEYLSINVRQDVPLGSPYRNVEILVPKTLLSATSADHDIKHLGNNGTVSVVFSYNEGAANTVRIKSDMFEGNCFLDLQGFDSVKNRISGYIEGNTYNVPNPTTFDYKINEKWTMTHHIVFNNIKIE
jgi:hypothetical protein